MRGLSSSGDSVPTKKFSTVVILNEVKNLAPDFTLRKDEILGLSAPDDITTQSLKGSNTVVYGAACRFTQSSIV